MIGGTSQSQRLPSFFVLVIALAACDELVYAPAELAAQEKFSKITPGATQQDLQNRLGAPKRVVILNKVAGVYEYFLEASTLPTVTFHFEDPPRENLPPEILHPRRNKRTDKILIFDRGTVWGYYHIGLDGRVVDKFVFVG